MAIGTMIVVQTMLEILFLSIFSLEKIQAERFL